MSLLSIDARKHEVLVDQDVELGAGRMRKVGWMSRFLLIVRSATRPNVSAKFLRAASEAVSCVASVELSGTAMSMPVPTIARRTAEPKVLR